MCYNYSAGTVAADITIPHTMTTLITIIVHIHVDLVAGSGQTGLVQEDQITQGIQVLLGRHHLEVVLVQAADLVPPQVI